MGFGTSGRHWNLGNRSEQQKDDVTWNDKAGQCSAITTNEFDSVLDPESDRLYLRISSENEKWNREIFPGRNCSIKDRGQGYN